MICAFQPHTYTRTTRDPRLFLRAGQDLAAGQLHGDPMSPRGGDGVDVGAAPRAPDTDALDPVCHREVVHAVVLTGGSAFGLDAAGGVMGKLEEAGIGRDVMVTVVPNVCAAVLFDLKFGSMEIRPDVAMGYAACEAALKGGPFRRKLRRRRRLHHREDPRPPVRHEGGASGACAVRQGS